ncbi:unnamed protein product [Chrysodeixis includens]|uniref:Sulfotransferase domain-containing protein n=1 Tax=Chrysodeixis includens TaxID=689277 RepID=A0A9N8PXD5_CHRIL|nr:unnamed protein product [Chrysodeixis includens]
MEEQTVPFPYQCSELEGEDKELVERTIAANPIELLRLGPKGYIVFKPYMRDAENIYNMPLRPSDVFVASYQRSGTTVTQELVWQLLNDFDYEKAKEIPLTARYSFLEEFMFIDSEKTDIYIENAKKADPNFDPTPILMIGEMFKTPASTKLATAPSPRFIKTHLPMSFLPPKVLETAKVVYIAREPRDVAVSCYHQTLLFKVQQFEGGFKEFWNLFHRSLFTLTPFFEHLKEAWNLRHHPNMLFLFYEDVTKDKPAAIRRIAAFFGKTITEEQVARLSDHLDIKNFKKNKSVNNEELKDSALFDPKESFIRKGKSGGWRDYFDEEMTQQAERWIADNLRDTDLRFPKV